MDEKKQDYVLKSHPLVRLQTLSENLTLGMLKLIDIYLARIDPSKPEQREVSFTLREYSEILDIEQDGRVARSRTISLMTKQNAFSVPSSGEDWRVITLFEECRYENGVVTMKCTGSAAEYIFELAKYGYIRYKLKYILQLKSRHAYNLYLYILDNRFRGSWKVGVDFLRDKVYHTNVEYYEAFKYFKRDVLDRSVAEVNEKTDAHVSYTIHKNGRKVTDITFRVSFKKGEIGVLLNNEPGFEPVLNSPEPVKNAAEPVQLYFDGDNGDIEDDPVMWLADAVDNEFSRTELEAVRFRLLDIIPDPQDINGRWDYLHRTWQKVKIIAEKRPINDTHAYLLAVLDQEANGRR